MTQYNLTSAFVNPTAADVAGSSSAGFGRSLMESTFGKLLTGICGKGGWILEGFTPPSPGASISNYGYTGSAVVSGYLVKTTNTCYVSFPASSTVYVYLRLLRETWGTEQLVSQAVMDVLTSHATYDDSCLLWIVTTGSSTVSSVTDCRLFGSGHVYGRYTGDGTNSRTISVAELDSRYPTLLFVFDPDAATPKWIVVVRYESGHYAYLKQESTLAAGFDAVTIPVPASAGFTVNADDNWNSNGRVYRYLVLA